VALFPRKKSDAPLVVAVVPDADSDTKSRGGKNTTPKKGHATPKRSEVQAARRTPIVTSTGPKATNRPLTKEEKAAQRQKDRAVRDEAYVGMKAGVEKHLPARDKGPQKRYIRQYVDARRNMGELFMPVVFGFIILNMILLQFGFANIAGILTIVMYLTFIIAAIDTYFMWRRLKAELTNKFGDVERGSAMYASMRAVQIRKMRIPSALTTRGDFPS